MNLCIPIEEPEGVKSKVYGHFGSAPFFLIYDTEQKNSRVLENGNQHHSHGMCQPLQALANEKLGAVVCQGMGARAVQKLNEGGIRAYRVSSETVEGIVKDFLAGALQEITVENACQQHSCH